jgi:hypothetical protein
MFEDGGHFCLFRINTSNVHFVEHHPRNIPSTLQMKRYQGNQFYFWTAKQKQHRL